MLKCGPNISSLILLLFNVRTNMLSVKGNLLKILDKLPLKTQVQMLPEFSGFKCIMSLQIPVLK